MLIKTEIGKRLNPLLREWKRKYKVKSKIHVPIKKEKTGHWTTKINGTMNVVPFSKKVKWFWMGINMRQYVIDIATARK